MNVIKAIRRWFGHREDWEWTTVWTRSFRGWETGEIISAAAWNQYIRDKLEAHDEC
jgi:hypothetical protein